MHRSQDPKPAGHVALVDDDASVRRALARVLSPYFYSIHTYSSGMEFLQSLESSAPDCLMLDLNMPGMTGLEVLRHLAARDFSFPVVILTAQDELGVESRCQLAGATMFLEKPIAAKSLIQAVTAVMGIATAEAGVQPAGDMSWQA